MIRRNKLESIFPNVDMVFIVCFSLPVTNWSAERAFLKLTRTKNSEEYCLHVTQYSPLEAHQHFGRMYDLHFQGWRITSRKEMANSSYFSLVSCLAYCSTPKVEAVQSSKMSVDFFQGTWCYIREGSSAHSQHCENLKSSQSSCVTT